MITKSTPSSTSACTAAIKFMCVWDGRPAHLFGCVSRVVHPANALLGGQAQLFDQQGQIDAESLSGFDAAPGMGMAQTVFCPGKHRCRIVPCFHEHTVITC